MSEDDKAALKLCEWAAGPTTTAGTKELAAHVRRLLAERQRIVAVCSHVKTGRTPDEICDGVVRAHDEIVTLRDRVADLEAALRDVLELEPKETELRHRPVRCQMTAARPKLPCHCLSCASLRHHAAKLRAAALLNATPEESDPCR